MHQRKNQCIHIKNLNKKSLCHHLQLIEKRGFVKKPYKIKFNRSILWVLMHVQTLAKFCINNFLSFDGWCNKGCMQD